MHPLITFSQFHFRPGARFWALRQMGTFGASMRSSAARSAAGLRFWKLLGTGVRFGGFAPDWSRYALLAVWDGEDAFRTFWSGAEVIKRYRSFASSSVTHRLATTRCSGSWDGRQPFGDPVSAPPAERIAVLTRATLRPSRQLVFWRHATPVEPEIARAAGLVSAVSIGELPILRSGTFSIWESAEAIKAFAHRPSHRAAMHARTKESLYEEELFARFAVLGTETEG